VLRSLTFAPTSTKQESPNLPMRSSGPYRQPQDWDFIGSEITTHESPTKRGLKKLHKSTKYVILASWRSGRRILPNSESDLCRTSTVASAAPLHFSVPAVVCFFSPDPHSSMALVFYHIEGLYVSPRRGSSRLIPPVFFPMSISSPEKKQKPPESRLTQQFIYKKPR